MASTDSTTLPPELDGAVAAMRVRQAAYRAALDRTVSEMTDRALGRAEISPAGRFLVASALRHCLQWEMSSDDSQRLVTR